MRIDLKIQASMDATLPPLPVKIYTGSALPLELSGIPSQWCGGDVTAVKVTVTNADGVAVTGSATLVNGEWRILFAPSNFANYGTVEKGVKVVVTVTRSDETTADVILAVTNLEIVASTASATPGTPSAFYVVKGDRVFVRSRKVGDIQHFVEQTMEYDSQIGWGANWSGDYILSSSGEFIEYTEAS